MPHIESDIVLLPYSDGDADALQLGKVMMRRKLNKQPSVEWQSLFGKASNTNLVATAKMKFNDKRLEYMTDLTAETEERFAEIRAMVEEANRLAIEHNAREQTAFKESMSKAEADKKAFAEFNQRMKGK